MSPNRLAFIHFLFLSIVFSTNTMAQMVLCNGALGDPVVNIDFSRGTAQHGSAIPASTFFFQPTGTPADGWYTIAKSTAGMHPGNWHQITNHTPNDPDGYMMIVNASPAPSVFYETTITGLCPNTTYKFAAWVINLLTYNGIKPNITFTILTTQGNILATSNTGDIPEGSATEWINPSLSFTMPSNLNDVVIRMQNNGAGGNGNDIAVDDITFSPCGPVIVPSIDGTATQNKNMCAGDTKSPVLAADVSPGVYTNPQYLWQEMVNGVWHDMPTEITNRYIKKFINAQPGNYKYRLLVADQGNINSPNCRTTSPEFEFKVYPIPVPLVKPEMTVCIGSPIQLSVSKANTYKWTGPNGFSDLTQSPVINNATTAMSGTYHVTVTNEGGCEQTEQIILRVVPQVTAIVDPIAPICQGNAAQLNASGGTNYSWSPSIGLSDAHAANPMASPKLTTTYTVTVSNGACEASAAVTLIVNENATAYAGADKKILEGQQTTLDGVVGDNSNFFWSPAEGLDDPYKLNPIAAPNRDITYTLNTISKFGCGSAADQVLVKVYKTVIVPNSFSPNGDGMNDLWNITAIETYANSNVKIMNRYGRLLFESSGYEKPWNGKYKNEDLPSGVYYYVIHLNPELKPLTGSLMLIR